MSTLRRCALCAVIVALADLPARAVDVPPAPSTHVSDRAGVLAPGTERQIDVWLTDLERKTGAEFIVLTVRTTGDADIFTYAMAVAEAWKLGRKDRDDGLLLVVAVDDRKYRFVTGYGLEGVLPDSALGTIGRDTLAPNFKAGRYDQGISHAVRAIVQRMAPDQPVAVGTARRPMRFSRRTGSVCSTFWVIAVVVLILWTRIRRRGYRTWGGPFSPYGRRWHRGLGSFGGFGGGWGNIGGFGGGRSSFGGGGGGRFGGGGAGGGW